MGFVDEDWLPEEPLYSGHGSTLSRTSSGTWFHRKVSRAADRHGSYQSRKRMRGKRRPAIMAGHDRALGGQILCGDQLDHMNQLSKAMS